MLYLQINGTICIAKQRNSSRCTQWCSVFVAIVLDTQTNAAQMNFRRLFQKYCRVGRSSGCTAQESIVWQEIQNIEGKIIQYGRKNLITLC